MSEKHRFRIAENFEKLQQRWEDFEERLTLRIWENKIVKTVLPYLRGVLIYLFYAFVSGFSISALRVAAEGESITYFDHPNLVLRVLEILFSVLIAQSAIQTFAIYSRTERQAFMARESDEIEEEKERKKILTYRPFWIELFIFWGLFLLHPVFLYQDSVLRLFPQTLTWHPIFQKLLTLPILFGATFWFGISTRIEAMRTWVEASEKMAHKRFFSTRKRQKKRRRRFSLLRMFFRLALSVFAFALSSSYVLDALALVMSVLRLFVLMFSLLWFNILLVALFALIVLRSVFARLRWMRKFKRLCRENGFTVFYRKRVYLSVFFNPKGFHLGLEANGKRYCCRFISCFRRGNDMYFSSESLYCTRVFTFRLRLPVVAQTRGYAVMNKDSATPTDLIRFIVSSRSFDFRTEDLDATKILLLNPVPSKAYVTSYEVLSPQTSTELDNGMDVGEYKIFSGGAFLRALERNAIEETYKKTKRTY